MRHYVTCSCQLGGGLHWNAKFDPIFTAIRLEHNDYFRLEHHDYIRAVHWMNLYTRNAEAAE